MTLEYTIPLCPINHNFHLGLLNSSQNLLLLIFNEALQTSASGLISAGTFVFNLHEHEDPILVTVCGCLCVCAILRVPHCLGNWFRYLLGCWPYMPGVLYLLVLISARGHWCQIAPRCIDSVESGDQTASHNIILSTGLWWQQLSCTSSTLLPSTLALVMPVRRKCHSLS